MDGKPIQAHGGSVLEHEGVFYWFGEHKGGTTYFSHTIGWGPCPSRHPALSASTACSLGFQVERLFQCHTSKR